MKTRIEWFHENAVHKRSSRVHTYEPETVYYELKL
jgi:hypothetical protein